MTTSPLLAGRVALVTGASRGIGAAVAERLAREGAHVVLVARTVGGLEEVDDRIRSAGGSATLVPFDLMDTARIDVLGQSVFDRFGRLDVLVGNAGMLGHFGPVAQFDPKTWDRVIATNLTANFRLIRTFDRVLRASDAGRAIFVTSGAVAGEVAYGGAYAVSKASLESMVKLYAAEVARSSLRVNLIDPGVVRTKLRAQGFPGEDPSTLPAPEDVAGLFVELASPACTRHGEIVRA
ncbi:SDR family NAD(P)-dependent oxidoreductase [Arenibaculum pallidiluteum]|uniref:SDR family NAD(P)-dependent oxidoreductase n=1 Tax=Arenibaculum pallidiluteum TaxID=2812559 RepID=UPI001A960988|nr:SDR family NAD(P)-dependent oxidoreductase [Arenibaculum pallidiluteum]